MLLLDRLERQVLSDRQVAALQAVMSGQGGELPNFDVQRACFDAALAEEPQADVIDQEQWELRRALGVA